MTCGENAFSKTDPFIKSIGKKSASAVASLSYEALTSIIDSAEKAESTGKAGAVMEGSLTNSIGKFSSEE